MMDRAYRRRRVDALRTCLASKLIAAALLASCAAPTPDVASPPAPPPPPPPAQGGPIVQSVSRWVPVTWSELPGYADDRVRDALPALLRNCDNVVAGPTWTLLCNDLRRVGPQLDETGVRRWLAERFDPYRVEASGGRTEGLATGYFEPTLAASRLPRGAQRYALHKPPQGFVAGKPWHTRKDSETLAEAQAALRGREIAYVADPLDVLMLQVQGSGRLVVTEPDGRVSNVRIAYAGHNDRPYQSVGRWLIDQGELSRDGASWPAIREWARRNPQRVQAMLWANPRLVFFNEEPLPDPSVGPRGAQGVPLTVQRSIAVDPKSIPYGTPVWLDTTEPLSSTPLRRLVVAQDTGSAITGAVRADYFWGPGERAEQQAGRMKQPLRMWVFVPRLGQRAER